MKNRLATATLLSILVSGVAQAQSRGELDPLIEAHARAQNVPAWVVHRVIKRESNYNPRAKGGSALGLMQIKHPTARGVGYRGDAAGLYDASTNLKYGVAYLAGAWRLAGGDYDTCYRHYQRGYYYSAKQARLAPVVGRDPIMAAAPPAPAAQSSFSIARLLGLRQDPAPAAAPAGGTQALAYAASPAAQPASAAPSGAPVAQADLVEVPVPPRRPAASARRTPSRIALARKQQKQEAVAAAEAAVPAPAATPAQATAQATPAAARPPVPAQAAAPAPAAAPGQTASMFATALPAPVKAPVQEASADASAR